MTLIEVMAAVGIAGLVMLGTVLLLDSLSDSTRRITREGVAMTREGTGRLMLRRLLSDAEPSVDSARRFRGEERSIGLTTRCPTPQGWSVSCQVTLAIDSTGDTSTIMAQFDNGDQLVLRRIAGAASLRYFDHTAPDSAWRRRWDTNATLPSAVGVLVGGDTTLYPVGPSRD